MSSFCHLHLHTDASILDGLGTVHRTVEQAKKLGFTRLAMTDHGTLANAVTFTIACEEAGIKPILGEEIYIKHENKIGHLTLLADGQKGFESLVGLTNFAHRREQPSRRPFITLDELQKFNQDITCLTGCIAAPTHWLPYSKAVKFVADLRDIFDKRVFAEVMFVTDEDIQSRPLRLAKKLGLESLVTNDVHFAMKADAVIHPILTTMKAAFSYASSQLWLKSVDELTEIGNNFVGSASMKRFLEIAGHVGSNLRPVSLKREPSLPSFGKNDDLLLRKKCIEALKIFLAHNKADRNSYIARLKYELDIIKKMGYSTYFLVLEDIISFARTNKIVVGPGRGSGAASLILYLLKVTGIDPLVYELNFERFLNLYRVGFPDVDVDFESDGRPRVIDYAISRWGAFPISTYAHYSHKTLVHDLARTLKLPRDLDKAAADKGVTSSEFKELNKLDPRFGQAYKALNGQIRHKGKHAGGVVVTDSIVPIEKSGNELLVAWTEGDHKELTYAGIVKFDFLGLSSLSALKTLKRITGKDPAKPGADKKIFEVFKSGHLGGIFQFSGSSGIRELTIAVQPSTFMDIVAVNALYRPGALDAGTAWHYAEWKQNPRKVHPAIDEILEETYGVIVFQEQLMEVYATIVGGSLAESDYARQVIVKSKQGDPQWEASFAKIKKDFYQGGLKNKFTRTLLDSMWIEIATHARYSFNKSHSVAYSKIAWDLAWYKLYYPAQFFATMMRWDSENLQSHVFEAIMIGVNVYRPDINISTDDFVVQQNEIYFPLSSIKYMGIKGAKAVVAARRPLKQFKKVSELLTIKKREVTSRAWMGLAAVGGLTQLKGETAALFKSNGDNANGFEADIKYLGTIVPTKDLIDLITQTRGDAYVGIVAQIKKKESKYGQYYVYSLSPNGVFWIRSPEPTLRVGDIVSAHINDKSGKAVEVERIELT